MEHLKSCPFCGNKDIMLKKSDIAPKLQNGDYAWRWFVGCKKCDIYFRESTAEQAIEAWNKRTDNAQLTHVQRTACDEQREDYVPKYAFDVVNNRLKHLLKSKFIASFDKVKLFSGGEYVRNIDEADAFIEVLKTYISMDKELLRKYADTFSDFIERTK